ncbi:MAG: hypothetical protein PVI30_20400 [Myxococcales bacterium]|jgi:hypothetical protein
MASEEITCPMCGGKNPAGTERCNSCGARVEELRASWTPEEQYARRYQQEDFEWKWALIAAGVLVVLQGVIIGLLPKVIHAFDPQGIAGLMLTVPICFVGGIAVGAMSPGKTFVEPAVGAIIAAVPTLGLISAITPDGFQPTMLAYVVCASMGVMMALFGAFVGEKLQPAGPARAPSR